MDQLQIALLTPRRPTHADRAWSALPDAPQVAPEPTPAALLSVRAAASRALIRLAVAVAPEPRVPEAHLAA